MTLYGCNMQKKLGFWHKVLVLLAHFFIRLLFFKVINFCRVLGKGNIPAGGGVLVVSNHLSVFDPLLIPSACLRVWPIELMYTPAKAELFRIPVIRGLIKTFGGFPVKRGVGDVKAMRLIIKLMKEEKMVIFPEGTRSSDGALGTGNRAVGRLIYEARPLVVPVAIKGTEKMLSKGKKLFRPFAPLRVTIGQPLKLDRYFLMEDTREASGKIIDEIMRDIARLQQAC